MTATMRTSALIRSLAGLAAGASLLASAAPASAADVTAVARVKFVAAGPAISGDRLAYGTSGSTGVGFSLYSATLGSPATALFTKAAPDDVRRGTLDGVDVALSSTRTAFAFGENLAVDPDGATAYQQALAGPPTGPFSVRAGSDDGNLVVDALDVSGDALLTLERTSSGRKAIVRDLAADGGAAKQVGGDLVLTARIAGDYVAFSTPSSSTVQRVSVTNWRTGVELYRIDVPVTPPYGFGFGLDVQEDGTIAVRPANPLSVGSRPKVDLAWASAAEPTLHPLASDVGKLVTRIAGGKILFDRAHDAVRRELAVADLAGTVTTASFPLSYVTGADLDAGKIAFATASCVYGGDVPAAAPAIAPAGTCPQNSLSLTTASTQTKGKVKVIVGCVMAASTGCAGAVTLQTPRAKNRKVITLATRGYVVAAGKTTTFTVTMTKRRLRSLRNRVGKRHTKAFVDVIARAKDDASLTTSIRRDASVRLK